MAGNKTHDQQQRIIEKRVDTSNADAEFDLEQDLKRSETQRRRLRDDEKLRSEGVELSDSDDREMIRGTSQESRHRKQRPGD